MLWPISTSWGVGDRIDFSAAYACLSWFAERVYPWSPLSVWTVMCVGAAVYLLVFAWWWRFLYVGLHRYLRFDKRNTIALLASTQIIGVLVMVLLLLHSEVAHVVRRFLGRTFG